MVIKKHGKKWFLYTSDGKKLIHCHLTRARALAQERAIHVRRYR